MRVVFIHGPPAVGKLTIAREVAKLTGLPVFHNHLVVDAVASVFPFGCEAFGALREKWWLDMLGAAAADGRSVIFTFQPEPSVDPEFPKRVVGLIEGSGGSVDFVALEAADSELERRIAAESRREFGKLQSADLLQELREQFRQCETRMPTPSLTLRTDECTPSGAAQQVVAQLGLGLSAS